MKRRAILLFSLGAGATPGLVLPFILPFVVGLHDSDATLLALSVAMAVSAILASTSEASAIAATGRVQADSATPSLGSIARTSGQLGLSLAIPALGLFTAISLAYIVVGAAVGDAQPVMDLRKTWPLAIVPIVAVMAAPWSATLVSAARLPPVLFSTFFRAVPALIALMLTSDIFAVCVAFVLGELARWGFLGLIARQEHILGTARGMRSQDIATIGGRELFAQISAQSIAQVGPIIARTILVAGPVGALTMGEIANRVYQAVYQVSSSAIVLPRIPKIPAAMSGATARARVHALRTNGKRIFLEALLLAFLAGGVALTAALLLPSNNRTWATGVAWGVILLASLPFAAVNIFAARGIVYVRQARLLNLLSGAGVVMTAAVGWLVYLWLGPIASVIGVSLAQVTTGTLSWILLAGATSRFEKT